MKGNPVMFGETAHANVHAITLDPSKELKRLRLVCCGKETIVGILAVTLYREAASAFGGIPVNPKLPMSFGVDSAAFARTADVSLTASGATESRSR